MLLASRYQVSRSQSCFEIRKYDRIMRSNKTSLWLLRGNKLEKRIQDVSKLFTGRILMIRSACPSPEEQTTHCGTYFSRHLVFFLCSPKFDFGGFDVAGTAQGLCITWTSSLALRNCFQKELIDPTKEANKNTPRL